MHDELSGDRAADGEFESFVAMSVALTGFSEAELASTGSLRAFFDELALIVGRSIRSDFLAAAVTDPGSMLADARWQPVAQNLIRMWYVGQWQCLPPSWAHDNFDAAALKDYDPFGRDANRVISAAAFREGLVWRAIGTNPPGAKQPGFASWTRRLK